VVKLYNIPTGLLLYRGRRDVRVLGGEHQPSQWCPCSRSGLLKTPEVIHWIFPWGSKVRGVKAETTTWDLLLSEKILSVWPLEMFCIFWNELVEGPLGN